jgi:hypothetical protein
MEQSAHMRFSDQSFHTLSQVRFAVGVCMNEGITARFNAKALQEVALRYWARGTKAACVGH